MGKAHTFIIAKEASLMEKKRLILYLAVAFLSTALTLFIATTYVNSLIESHFGNELSFTRSPLFLVNSTFSILLLTSVFPGIFFSVWLIDTHQTKKVGSNNYQPKVSVITPCYNESKNVVSMISAVVNQDYPGEIEVIVVDDGSSDDTYQLAVKTAAKLKGQPRRTIKIYRKENGGKPDALNYGVKKAAGEIFVFSDGDSCLARDAVRLLVKEFADSRVGTVAGIVNVRNKKGIFAKLQQIEYVCGQYMFRFLQSEDGNVLITPGCIFGIRASIAKQIPSSNRTVVEDCDLTICVRREGYATKLEPKAFSFTNAPTNWKSWWNQRKRWIYGYLQAWRIHKKWMKHNPWALYHYFNYSFVSSIIVTFYFIQTATWLVLPLTTTYQYTALTVLLVYNAMSFAIFTLLRLAAFAHHNKEWSLLLLLPVYMVYSTVLSFTRSYLYIRYLLGKGTKFKYGPRILHIT